MVIATFVLHGYHIHTFPTLDKGILPIPNISTAGRSRKQFIYLASYMRRGLEGSTSSGAITTGVGDLILSGLHSFKTPICTDDLSYLILKRDSVLYMAEADGN